MSRPTVSCIGMVTLDLISQLQRFPAADSETRIEKSLVALGGPIGRGAVAAHRLGANVKLLSMVGTGAESALFRSEVAGEGLSATLVEADAPMQHSVVIVAREEASRTILWEQSPRATEELLAKVPTLVAGSDCVLTDCTDEELTRVVAAEAHWQRVPVVIDTGSYKPWFEEIARLIDFIIVPAKFLAARSPGVAVSDGLAAAHRDFGSTVTVVTRGARGGLWRDAEGEHAYDAVTVDAVDSCGAGDVFHGAFAVAVARGLDAAAAVRLSAWAAAEKCRVLGNASIPHG